MTADVLLHASLLACTAYFVCMCLAHFIGFKVPILFVYWNVPSNHYQDMIISFCALTYAVLFAGASMIPAAVPVALVALAGTVLGLSAVNLSKDLREKIQGGSTVAYWAQTGMIAGLLVWLGLLHQAVSKTVA
jgi:hypothetical protein